MKSISIMTATGQGNLGDELILANEVRRILACSKRPIRIYTHSTDRTKYFLESQGIDLSYIRFRTYFPNYSREYPVRNMWYLLGFLMDLFRTKTAVVGGWGLFYDPDEQGGSGTHPVKLWKYRIRALHWFRIPIVYLSLWVTTNEPIDDLLRTSDIVCVRDEQSLARIKDIAPHAFVLPDPVFAHMPPHQHTEKAIVWEAIGIACRETDHLDKLLAHSIKSCKKLDIDRIGLSHSLHPVEESLDDQLYMQENGIESSATLPETLHAYRHVDMVLTNRFHGIVLALLFGIPVLPIATSTKLQQLCQENKLKYITTEDKNAFDTIDDFLENPEAYRTDSYHIDQLAKLYEDTFERHIVPVLAD